MTLRQATLIAWAKAKLSEPQDPAGETDPFGDPDAEALFDQAEAAAAAAKAEPDIHRRRERLSEAARLHRLAWEVKARGEYDVE